jgi:hypothetical protein
MSRSALAAALAAGCFVTAAHAQLRVATWNISSYSGGRVAPIQTAVYASFEGRSMSPDALAVQEVLSLSGQNALLAALNSAPDSPGDWAAATFVDGADTDASLFYRTSKLSLIANRTWTIAVGSTDPNNQPRNTYRYDLRPVGYAADTAALSIYSVHMKAGNSSSDNARRLVESQRIRDNAAGINTNGAGSAKPALYQFMVLGDFNMQSSNQTSYQKLIASEANNLGRFFDPILTPGSWNNSFDFRFVHTQDPIGAGGMDDRHDQILVGAGLRNGTALDYLGLPIAYSTSTWNDPNHTYRAYGNDGTSFNTTLRVVGNTMVGPVIAQALIDAAAGAGHLPVFLDLLVPAKVSSDLVLDFGILDVNDPAQLPLHVFNNADTLLWSAAGASNLNYSLAASVGFAVAPGPFVDAPGGVGNLHTVTLDTSTPGLKLGTLTIASDDPDQPTRLVTLLAEVREPAPDCPADFNGDGVLDFFDYDDFVSCYEGAGDPGCDADFNADGVVDFFDYDDFVLAYETGC